MTFMELLSKACRKGPGTRVCVGLDVDTKQMPPKFAKTPEGMMDFALRIAEVTHQYAAAFKINLAFWAAEKAENILEQLVLVLREKYPNVVLIGDAKRGDIGNTCLKYAKEVFERYSFHACTFNGYLGASSIEPFLGYGSEYGVFALARTSNKDATLMQDGLYTPPGHDSPMPYYVWMAQHMTKQQNEKSGTIGLVMGATVPDQINNLEGCVSTKHPLLLPGIGKQAGDLENTVKNAAPWLFIVNASRSVTHASSNDDDFQRKASDAARKLRDDINFELAKARNVWQPKILQA